MGWQLSTDDALTAVRDAIGASVTVNGTTLTWTKQVEGEPLRWLETTTDYPLIIHRLGDTDVDDGAKLLGLTLTDDISVVVKASHASSGGIAPAAYKTARMVGEAVVGKIMDAGPRLGTSWLERRLVSCGVDYDTTAQMTDHGLLVYVARFSLTYYEAEVAP